MSRNTANKMNFMFGGMDNRFSEIFSLKILYITTYTTFLSTPESLALGSALTKMAIHAASARSQYSQADRV